MTRQFIPPPGAVFPATLADYKRAKAGDMEKVRWACAEDDKPVAAPYPEIITSWLANGFVEIDGGKSAEVAEEVNGDGIQVG